MSEEESFRRYIDTLDVENVQKALDKFPTLAKTPDPLENDLPLVRVSGISPYTTFKGYKTSIRGNSDRQLQIVDILVREGAEINALSGEFRLSSPLESAIVVRNRRLIKHLLDLGANPNLQPPENNVGNILFTAHAIDTDGPAYDIVVLLVLYGFDIAQVKFGSGDLIKKEVLPVDLQNLIKKFDQFKETRLKDIDQQLDQSPGERAAQRAAVLGRADFFPIWKPTTHSTFKRGFKDVVYRFLLSGNRYTITNTVDGTQIPTDILFYILRFVSRPDDVDLGAPGLSKHLI